MILYLQTGLAADYRLLPVYVAYSPLRLRSWQVGGDGREYPELSGNVKAGRVCAGQVGFSGHGIGAAEAKKDESGLSKPLTSSSNQL